MYLDKTTQIAGWPAIQLRDALRGFHGWPFALEDFAAALKASEAQAAQLVADLMMLGYLRQVDSQETEDRQWQCTEEGFRLADARTTKPYRRAVAEQHLAALLERAREVNASDQYLYWVKRVVLFGSMLTDQPLVGDVDLAVLLVMRADDTEMQRANEEDFIKRAKARGLSFSTYIEQLAYPQTVVWKHLKARSRILSLHPYNEFALMKLAPEKVKVLMECESTPGADAQT